MINFSFNLGNISLYTEQNNIFNVNVYGFYNEKIVAK